MAPRHPSLIVTLTFSALVAIAPGPVQAADSALVDAATQQVELGAQQIGRGQVLVGAGELAKGIGNTIVEGAKFTGKKLAEADGPPGPTRPTRGTARKEGAVAFGSSVRDFFVDLFGG